MVGQASRLSINYDGQDARPTSDPLSCGDCFAPLALTQTSGAYRNRKGDSPVAPTDPRDLEDFETISFKRRRLAVYRCTK